VNGYPHPAFLGLFDLDEIVRYKVRARDVAGWHQALRLMRSLGDAGQTPRLLNVDRYVPLNWPWTKANEDCLDAIVCAYVAAYFRVHGTSRSLVIGDLSTGYMVTPVSARTEAALRSKFGDEINPEGVAHPPAPSTPPATPAASAPPIPTSSAPPATPPPSPVVTPRPPATKGTSRAEVGERTPYRPSKEKVDGAAVRAAALLDELVVRAEEESDPAVVTYGRAWEKIFDDKAPHNLGSGYSAQVKRYIVAATGAFFPSLSSEPVGLEVFVVNGDTREPGAGHFVGKPYTIEDWRRVFGGARFLE
jgi:hypothetical protein